MTKQTAIDKLLEAHFSMHEQLGAQYGSLRQSVCPQVHGSCIMNLGNYLSCKRFPRVSHDEICVRVLLFYTSADDRKQ